MIVPSLFGELASHYNMQALIDNSLDFLQSQSIWRNYLDWGVPQTKLTFETAIGRTRINAAASIVDIDAPAPTRSRNKIDLLTGKIPTMKVAYELNQKDYRDIKQLEYMPISDEAKKQALIKIMYNDLQEVSVAPDRRLDIMFLGAVSNFSIDLTALGNPDGVALGTIDLLAPATNTRNCRVVWTDNASDPFADINDVVNYAAGFGYSFAEIWIDNSTWLRMKNLTNVKSAISGYQNPGSNKNFFVTLAIVNEYLVANRLPMIKIINERRGIEKDGLITTINPFNANNVVFVPAGRLGIMHNALSMEDMEPVEDINYAKFDRTLIAKWRENNPWKEFTQSELNAFPALENINSIFLLTTNIAAS